jgi:hypothetical protein
MSTEDTQVEEQDKNPVGRPLAFKDVEELDASIETYLGDCSPHISKHKVLQEKADGSTYWATAEYMTDQKPVTVAGAALALGVNRRTLLDYKERPEFLPSIEHLLAACEAYTESMLYTQAANGAKFSLANNFRGKYQNWSDKQEISGPDGAPLMPIGLDGAILNRMTNGKTSHSTTDDSSEPSPV